MMRQCHSSHAANWTILSGMKRLIILTTLVLGVACGGSDASVPKTLADCEREGKKYSTLTEMPADVVQACMKLSSVYMTEQLEQPTRNQKAEACAELHDPAKATQGYLRCMGHR